MTHNAENGLPPCPCCGRSLTAAYDDTDDSWWECDGCGGTFDTVLGQEKALHEDGCGYPDEGDCTCPTPPADGREA